MSIIPILTPKEVINALRKAGFSVIRQKGSHVRLENDRTGRSTTVAMHVKDISRKMISVILKQAGLSVKEFLENLKK